MKRLSVIVCVFIIGLASCKTDKSTGSDGQSTFEEVVEDAGPVAKTEADLGALYQYYHAAPTSQKEMDENKIIEYAAANSLSPERSPSGLYYVIDKLGSGPTLNTKDQIFAHYRGKTIAGDEFDSSYKRGKPIDFKIGEMIAGWNEAMTYMRKGDKATLLIPSHQGYGLQGLPGLIGPNETLVFEMEIVDKK